MTDHADEYESLAPEWQAWIAFFERVHGPMREISGSFDLTAALTAEQWAELEPLQDDLQRYFERTQFTVEAELPPLREIVGDDARGGK